MWELTVPLVEREDDSDGQLSWVPDIPDGWKFEQASSLLDTGKFAAKGNRLMVLSCYEDDAVVEAWADTRHGNQLVRAKPYGAAERLALANRGQGPAAMREWRMARNESLASFVRGRERAEQAKRVGRSAVRLLLPVAIGCGLQHLIGESGIALGTAVLIMSDKGDDGDTTELHGKSPSGTDRDTATWYNLSGLNGGAYVGLTGYVQVSGINGFGRTAAGATAAKYFVVVYNGADVADGDVRVAYGDFPNGRSSCAARFNVAANSGYFQQGFGNRRYYRRSSITSRTTLSSGVWSSTDRRSSILLRAVGSDHEFFGDATPAGGPGVNPPTTSLGTVSDATYSTGVWGCELWNNMQFPQTGSYGDASSQIEIWEGVDAASFIPDLTKSHLLKSVLLRGLAR